MSRNTRVRYTLPPEPDARKELRALRFTLAALFLTMLGLAWLVLGGPAL